VVLELGLDMMENGSAEKVAVFGLTGCDVGATVMVTG
jgi:hypothetical protein